MRAGGPAMTPCPKCGTPQPRHDSPRAERDAFLDNERTRKCGPCSALWLGLFFQMWAEVRTTVRATGSVH